MYKHVKTWLLGQFLKDWSVLKQFELFEFVQIEARKQTHVFLHDGLRGPSNTCTDDSVRKSGNYSHRTSPFQATYKMNNTCWLHYRVATCWSFRGGGVLSSATLYLSLTPFIVAIHHVANKSFHKSVTKLFDMICCSMRRAGCLCLTQWLLLFSCRLIATQLSTISVCLIWSLHFLYLLFTLKTEAEPPRFDQTWALCRRSVINQIGCTHLHFLPGAHRGRCLPAVPAHRRPTNGLLFNKLIYINEWIYIAHLQRVQSEDWINQID